MDRSSAGAFKAIQAMGKTALTQMNVPVQVLRVHPPHFVLTHLEVINAAVVVATLEMTACAQTWTNAFSVLTIAMTMLHAVRR